MTQVEICNLALRNIGAARITTFPATYSAATNEQERILFDIYTPIRDEVMSAHPWNFAVKRDTLTATTTPEYDWDYAYTLPTDCLRVISMEDGTDFEIAESVLMTDESEAKIKYIAQITDTTKYSPLFITAFATRIAAELAYSLAKNQDLFAKKFEEYQIKLKLAKSVDGQEGTVIVEEDTSWIDDRE